MRKLLWLGLLGVLVGCAQLAGPAFIRVELDGPPGFASHKLSRLEVVATTQIDGETATQTVLFDAQGLALPLSFVLEVIDPKERGLEVSLTVLGFTEGATQPVLFAQGEARARRDRIDLLADFCGDGKLDDVLAEECDDGNLQDGDGCSSLCQIEDLCGNGREDEGEECDDGNEIEGDGCDTNCTFSACGNGIKAPGEVCLTPAGSFPVGGDPSALVAADFDGDGLVDLAVTNEFSNDVSVLFNDGSSDFSSSLALALVVGATPRDLVAADFDSDNDLDLAVAAAGSDDVFVFENDLLGENGIFKTPLQRPVGTFPLSVAAGDLSGDTRPELVTANFFSNDISALLNKTNQNIFFDPAQSFVANAFGDNHRLVAVGELTQSGAQDVAVAVQFEAGIKPEIRIFEGSGNDNLLNTPPLPPLTLAQADFINAMEIGDLDGDGRNDLVIGHANLPAIGVFLGNGGGSFEPEDLSNNVGEGQRAVKLGDIDQDGSLDVVVLGSSLRALLGQGNGQLTSAQTVSVGAAPSALSLADLNGDGLLDVAVTDTSSDEVLILLQVP